ncbi:MAG: hypothetical protein AAFQ74_01800 [Cyanobacteria bacterium J06623_4]
MLQTVKGIYRNGKVELLESPEDVAEGEVLVTFLRFDAGQTLSDTSSTYHERADRQFADEDRATMISFGMFANDHEASSEIDFKCAEFHGDPDDGLDWS